MTQRTWISRILIAGSLVLAGTFVTSYSRLAHSAPASAGPTSVSCEERDGKFCSPNGIKIHCTTAEGIPGQCNCSENEWVCST